MKKLFSVSRNRVSFLDSITKIFNFSFYQTRRESINKRRKVKYSSGAIKSSIQKS
jgi:hypothetical protein